MPVKKHSLTTRLCLFVFLLSISYQSSRADTDGEAVMKMVAGQIICGTASIICGGVVGGGTAYATAGTGIAPAIAGAEVAAITCNGICNVGVTILFNNKSSSEKSAIRSKLKLYSEEKAEYIASLDLQLNPDPSVLSEQIMSMLPLGMIDSVKNAKADIGIEETPLPKFKDMSKKELQYQIDTYEETLDFYHYTLIEDNDEKKAYFQDKYASIEHKQTLIQTEIDNAMDQLSTKELDKFDSSIKKMNQFTYDASVSIEFAKNIFTLFGDSQSQKVAAELGTTLDKANQLANAIDLLSKATTPIQYMGALNSLNALGSEQQSNPEYDEIMAQLAVIDAKLNQLIEGQKVIIQGIVALGDAIESVSRQMETRFELVNFKLSIINQGVTDIFRNEYYGCRGGMNNAITKNDYNEHLWTPEDEVIAIQDVSLDSTLDSCKEAFSKAFRDLAANEGPSMFFYDTESYQTELEVDEVCDQRDIRCATYKYNRYEINERLLKASLEHFGGDVNAVFHIVISDGFFNQDNVFDGTDFVGDIEGAILNDAYLNNFTKPINQLTALQFLEDFARFAQVTYLECTSFIIIFKNCSYPKEYSAVLKRALQLANLLVAQYSVLEGEAGVLSLRDILESDVYKNFELVSDALKYNEHLAINMVREANYRSASEFKLHDAAEVAYIQSVTENNTWRRMNHIKSWYGKNLPAKIGFALDEGRWYFKVSKTEQIDKMPNKTSNISEEDRSNYIYSPTPLKLGNRHEEISISTQHLKAKYLRDKLVVQLSYLLDE